MPHMANLSWISLFSIFNLTLLMIFFSAGLCSTNMPSNNVNSFDTLNNKKWQW